MRITVFGAAGSVGSRIVSEALSRRHEVTAVVRRQAQLSALPAGAQRKVGDAARADQVAALCAGQDLVISATRPAPGKEPELIATAEALLHGAKQSGARLLLVGGAARLKVPDTGAFVVDDPRYAPASVRDIALACRTQFEVCVADLEADWTYLSPPALLIPGARTGRYRSGRDELLFDSEGKSTISIEDFAVALLDEAESPKHRRSGFTVAADPLAVTESDVTINTPDGSADCYFVHPSRRAYPGVIIWPDVLGLRPAFRTIGKRLAACGYSVLVINPHYRETAAPIGLDTASFNTPAGRDKAMRLANAFTPAMTMTDAIAFTAYLDQQESVHAQRKLGSIGYCIGGAMAIRTAAAKPARVGAIASFHGSRLVTQETNSPHLLIPNIRANALIAIAENDDAKDPNARTILRKAFEEAQLPAEIEVYANTTHGWCPPDTPAYNQPQADRAWSRLLVLLDSTLG